MAIFIEMEGDISLPVIFNDSNQLSSEFMSDCTQFLQNETTSVHLFSCKVKKNSFLESMRYFSKARRYLMGDAQKQEIEL